MINPNKGNSSLNTLVGIIDNALSSVSTAMPVTVIQVYDNHTLDVMPMIDMMDNKGNAVEHAPMIGIPYARLQGGDYGLIIKPKAGDKGLVVFASRDISDVVQSKEKTKPASLRKHSMSDGMYIASLLYEEPKTYLEITKDIVTIAVPTRDDMAGQASNIQVKNDEVIVAVGNNLSTSRIVIKDNDFLIESKNITLKGNVEIVGNATISKNTANDEMVGDNVETSKGNITGQLIVSKDAKIGEISFLEDVHPVIKEGVPTAAPQKS